MLDRRYRLQSTCGNPSHATQHAQVESPCPQALVGGPSRQDWSCSSLSVRPQGYLLMLLESFSLAASAVHVIKIGYLRANFPTVGCAIVY